ncbi:glycoside hydrolase family 88 protein [Sphingobacterium sp.]|uniref:glycoside hydrolase family 88 protein n=1 Tax=Sphingobacterium sp. TaxID=341027 RepID=UPI002897C5B0|nr:glycoside hydrolase family 88 protein [Sphingobacterium sp.]
MQHRVLFLISIALLFFGLCSFVIQERKRTIWMMGDSTMAIKAENKHPETGWGEAFAHLFNDHIRIENHAKNGKSTQSFIREGRWNKVYDGIQTGDYVFIQFGHNDQKITKPNPERFIPQYKAKLALFVEGVRKKKGIPILLTPIARRHFKNGELVETHGSYPAAVIRVADSLGVQYIDMTAKTSRLLRSLGDGSSKHLFLHLDEGHPNYPQGVEDNTHLNQNGAMQLANIVAESLREQNIPLAKDLKPASSSATLPLSEQMARSAMAKLFQEKSFTVSVKGPKWTYDVGVLLEGMTEVWRNTADVQYFTYVQEWMDRFVQEDGSIRNYRMDEYNIDHVKNGRSLLMLYEVTGKKKYLQASHALFNQLKTHPRTKEGGFWHKHIYPYQMWLDGLYMAQPFYVQYAGIMGMPEIYEDAVNQFSYMEKHARDSRTGLLYHGWDESRKERWANPQTGTSAHFWGRGMGWFAMALVDVLDHFPLEHPRRKELVAILQRTMEAVCKVQDPKTGVWYDIVDLPNRPGNYLEASASSMFVYAVAKSIRKGYLSNSYQKNLECAYQGLLNEFVRPSGIDRVDLIKVVAVSGLGGKKYRDGSFDYYMSEPVVANDPKGVGAFLLASAEMEAFHADKKQKTFQVLLDNYYNNEYKKAVDGSMRPYHYLWDGQDNNGFSFLGRVFEEHGAELTTLRQAGTKHNLKDASIYIIVDPDTEKETEHPNYMDEQHAAEIAQWVKQGGVLLLLLNDQDNCELEKTNLLAQKFGLSFQLDSKNRVKGRNFEEGAIIIPEGNEVFKTSRKIYVKELSTIRLEAPAKALLTHQADVVMATAKYGKGTVFALGDPWLYNEYVDGRKLPAEFQNFQAAQELVSWLKQQIKKD